MIYYLLFIIYYLLLLYYCFHHDDLSLFILVYYMPIFSVAKYVGTTLKRNQHMFRGTKHSHRAGFDQSHGNFQEFPTVKYVKLLVGG